MVHRSASWRPSHPCSAGAWTTRTIWLSIRCCGTSKGSCGSGDSVMTPNPEPSCQSNERQRRRQNRRHPDAAADAQGPALPLVRNFYADDRGPLPDVSRADLVEGSTRAAARPARRGAQADRHLRRGQPPARGADRPAYDGVLRKEATRSRQSVQARAAGERIGRDVRAVPRKAQITDGQGATPMPVSNVRRMNARQIVRLVQGAELMAQVTNESVADIVAHALGVAGEPEIEEEEPLLAAARESQ